MSSIGKLINVLCAKKPHSSHINTGKTPPLNKPLAPLHSLHLTIPALPPSSLFPKDIGLNTIFEGSLDQTVVEIMQSGLAKGTRGNYTSAINAYTKFCDEHHVRDDLRFPADERVLCLKNTAPAESKRPKRIADASVMACANAAFWGQARLGELVATSRLKHNPTTHPSRNSIIILFNNNAREIQLPKTKTNQANGQSIFLTRQVDPLDPVKAIENHLRINIGLDDSDHLFAFRSDKSHTGRHSLTHEDFMKRINEVWTTLGYQKVTGHSFRIGGTTTLLKNGVPPDIVKELGRWSSDAFHEYWRDVPSIAANYVEYLHIGEGASTFISDQARRPCPSATQRIGQNRHQGRPAFRPY
ncbi:hypothetical protein RSAG8_12690, partial [Rhizoctonia solani AG-8 WAC10335]